MTTTEASRTDTRSVKTIASGYMHRECEIAILEQAIEERSKALTTSNEFGYCVLHELAINGRRNHKIAIARSEWALGIAVFRGLSVRDLLLEHGDRKVRKLLLPKRR